MNLPTADAQTTFDVFGAFASDIQTQTPLGRHHPA